MNEPKVGEQWWVRIHGTIELRNVKIEEVTEQRVCIITNWNKAWYWKHRDIKFIEQEIVND